MNIKLEIKKYHTALLIASFLELAAIIMEMFTKDFFEKTLMNVIVIILASILIFVIRKIDKVKEKEWLNEHGNDLKNTDWETKPLKNNVSAICYSFVIIISIAKIISAAIETFYL